MHARPARGPRLRTQPRLPSRPRPARGLRSRAVVGAALLAFLAGAGTGAAVGRPVAVAVDQSGSALVDAAGGSDAVDAVDAAASSEGASADPARDEPAGPTGSTSSPTPVPSPEVPEPEVPAVPPVPPVPEPDRLAGLVSLEAPVAASGRLAVVAGAVGAPSPERRVLSVRVEVEEGLAVDGPTFAAFVMEVLNDPRGWGADGSVSFARTDAGADLRVVLASPATVDAMCAPLRTRGLYSCGRNGHAALNHTRWVQGAEGFVDLTQYRQYLVNHEVGHLLGRPHVDCPAPGAVAPVMQQQSIQVAPCVANGWPFPDGA